MRENVVVVSGDAPRFSKRVASDRRCRHADVLENVVHRLEEIHRERHRSRAPDPGQPGQRRKVFDDQPVREATERNALDPLLYGRAADGAAGAPPARAAARSRSAAYAAATRATRGGAPGVHYYDLGSSGCGAGCRSTSSCHRARIRPTMSRHKLDSALIRIKRGRSAPTPIGERQSPKICRIIRRSALSHPMASLQRRHVTHARGTWKSARKRVTRRVGVSRTPQADSSAPGRWTCMREESRRRVFKGERRVSLFLRPYGTTAHKGSSPVGVGSTLSAEPNRRSQPACFPRRPASHFRAKCAPPV